jgi:hypothetical protein
MSKRVYIMVSVDAIACEFLRELVSASPEGSGWTDGLSEFRTLSFGISFSDLTHPRHARSFDTPVFPLNSEHHDSASLIASRSSKSPFHNSHKIVFFSFQLTNATPKAIELCIAPPLSHYLRI